MSDGTLRFIKYRAVPAFLALAAWALVIVAAEFVPGFEMMPEWNAFGPGIVFGALLMDALLEGGHVNHV